MVIIISFRCYHLIDALQESMFFLPQWGSLRLAPIASSACIRSFVLHKISITRESPINFDEHNIPIYLIVCQGWLVSVVHIGVGAV